MATETFDLILRGAIAATPNGIAPADIAISGGRFAAIGRVETHYTEARVFETYRQLYHEARTWPA